VVFCEGTVEGIFRFGLEFFLVGVVALGR